MAFVGTTYGDISPRVGTHVIGKTLAIADQQLFLEKYARMEKLPKNVGKSVKWRRPIIFNVSTSALTEGVTPSPQAYEQEYVEATLEQYGLWVPTTDIVLDMHEDPILNDMSDMAVRNRVDTAEQLIYETIVGGSNVIYANGSARTDVNTVLTKDDVDAAVMTLKANYTPKLTKRLAPSTGIATEPINNCYIGYGHTYLEKTFREMDGFVAVENYSNSTQLSEYEIGKVGEVRIVLTNYANPFNDAGGSASGAGVRSAGGTSANIYPFIIFGEEAYGVATVKGLDGMSLTVKRPTATETDPLAQRGFVAWKFMYVCKILNDDRMVRIETAAPSL